LLTVLGLGNPGDAYRKTRHNAGFMVLDRIVEDRVLNDLVLAGSGFPFRLFGSRKSNWRKTPGLFVRVDGDIKGTRCAFVKPLTYMNESGRALASLSAKGVCVDAGELLVVTDDVDLEVGRIRLRQKGSAGGHNGLKSVIRQLGTDEFARLKVGVGPRPPGEDLIDYVLGSFRPEEWPVLNDTVNRAAHVVGAWVSAGYDHAHSLLSKQ